MEIVSMTSIILAERVVSGSTGFICDSISSTPFVKLNEPHQ
jgi:hypothetical protein